MRQQVDLGFFRHFEVPGGGGGGGPIYGPCPAAIAGSVQLFSASPDGTMVLGALDYPGRSMFGLFTRGTFRPLPPPPAGIPLTSIAW
jgi:hypothetical protein